MATAPALVLRTDGGPNIGGGHVMRCLALAQAWREAGGRAEFCAASLAPSLRRRVEENFAVTEIAAAAGSAGDADATLAAAVRLNARIVVVDGYHLRVDYRQRLRQAGLKLAALDDNGEIDTYVDDLVVNQNRHAAPDLYRRRADHTRLLLGTEYALLRREFTRWRGAARTFPPRVRTVLVTLGAADPDNVTVRVVAATAPAVPPAADLVVVIGGSNPHVEAIDARARQIPNCRLLRDPGDGMPALMAAADLAVCAGGSTMWEMAFMGVPFIPVVIAENQRQAVRAMAGDGYVAVDAATVERDLPAAAAAFAADAGRRETLSHTGRRLVDGQGAARVCAALLALAGNPVA
jgi:UDP-2,4-diacetamido-2,4,6-trideoxy-beta-L-altropyranose hydrolase